MSESTSDNNNIWTPKDISTTDQNYLGYIFKRKNYTWGTTRDWITWWKLLPEVDKQAIRGIIASEDLEKTSWFQQMLDNMHVDETMEPDTIKMISKDGNSSVTIKALDDEKDESED